MKIEDITKDSIKKVDNNELKRKRLIFIQLWEKYNKEKNIDTMTRDTFFKNYQILLDEMRERKIEITTKEIDKVLFKHKMIGIDINDLNKKVLVKDYISITGDFVQSPKVNDIEYTIKSDKENKKLEMKIAEDTKQLLSKQSHFIYSKTGANGSYIPLYNLILNPQKKAVKKRIIKADNNIYYESGDKGKAVLQLHIMGISEDESKKLKSISDDLLKIKHEPEKLKKLLIKTIGDKGAHLDLRMVKTGDNYFEGATVFIGNISGLSKINNQDLRFDWKKEGAKSWASAGKTTVRIFNPESEGATENLYGAMLLLDEFKFECLEQKKNSKKIKFTGSNLLTDGLYLFNFIPEDKKKIWIMSKIKEKSIFKIKKVEEEEHIVGGVVYSPFENDTDGDITSSEEIYKAMTSFMINGGKIKLMHQGETLAVPVIENIFAESDIYKGGKDEDHLIKQGEWWLSCYLGNELEIWDMIKSGEITGLSMAGIMQ